MAVVDSPDWPPPGWTEDVKVSNGRKIKYYTNGQTGKKFYSKKEVARYLNTKDTCDDVTQAMTIQGKNCSENNVSHMDNQDESFSKDNVSQMDNLDKSCSENNVSEAVGRPNNSHEWLPPGWIVELKTRKSGSHAGTPYKVYIDPSTGSKFYSKPEVSKYLKTMKQNNITGEGQIHGDGEVSSSNQKTSEDSKNIRGGGQTRKSKRLKSDTDQASPGIEEGSFSKLKASQDFEEVGEQSCTTKRKKSGITRTTKTSPSHGAGEDFILNEKTSLGSKENGAQSPQSKRQKPGSGCLSAKSVSSVAVDCDSADELPHGWKKESSQNDRGTREYLLYTDPVHGYKFHSKKEVLRYLQTGDASRCARRPAKRNVASTTKDDSPTTDDASLKKLGGFTTGRQPFSTDESKGGEIFGTCSPAQQVESSKKQPDCSVSDPNAIITSILAEINENHSFENVVEDAEIETVSVNVKQPLAVSTESDLLSEKQLLENEQEKHSSKATQQSKKSRKTESLNLGRRVSKRLAGQNIEAAADLDLGERALPAVVDKSASLSLSVNACSQELLQDSDPTPETGNSDQASLNGDPSLDDLPPGWKKEIKITKKANGIRKDPLYIDPVDGYVFRSKKDVFRYLQTGDISNCAIKPVKRDLDATMKESSPTTVDTNSKKLGCSVTERQPFAAKESRGRKRSVTCSPEVQAESSKKQPESSASNANIIITSSAADIIAKHSIQNAEISLDTEPEIRDSSADTKVIAAESNAIKRLSAVSTPQLDLPSEQQLLENEHEKHINKEKPEQSRRSRTKKPLTPGRRISKRLVGHSPEPVADLDLGERAFRAVVKKSASLGIPLNVSGQEFSQNKDPTVGTGNSDQAPLRREASGLEFPPDLEKEILTQNEDLTVGTGNSDQASQKIEASGDGLSPGLEKEIFYQNKDPTVGTVNSDQASLSKEASGDELSPGLEKEILAQNKDPTVGTGNADQASLSRKASGDELSPGLEKEILTHYKDPTVGSGNSDQASLSRKAALDEIPPGWEKEMLGQNKYSTEGTGNSDQASLSRKLSPDEIPPGWENEIPPGWKYEIPAQNKDPIVGTTNSDQASLSREKVSLDEIPPGWEKEILAYNKDPAIRTGNSDQASLSRELASADELPPGWEKEMLTRNKYPTVGTGNFNSLDDIPPGWEKELLVQQKDHTVGTGNTYLSFLSKEASVDGLPPGWKTEFRMRKNARVIKKDPYYMDPVHGYVFRSKKDVMRYLQTGDIRSCAVKPTKRDPGSTMKDSSPSTHDTSSKKLKCSLAGIQLSATDESKGSKCSVTCSMALQAENSSEHSKSSMFNLNTSISSIVADITEKHSYENVNEDTEIRLDVEPEIRDSVGDTKAAAAETVDVRRSLVVSPQLDFLPEQQLPENEKEKQPARLRKFRNSKSSTPVRRVSKRLSRHSPEMVTDLNLGERVLQTLVNNSASSGVPMNVSGGESAQQTDLATGDSDQPSLSRKASSRNDPLKVVKCLSEGQAFNEQNDERILQDSQPAGISYERGKVHLEQHALNERPTEKLAKEEQDGQNRLLNNSQLAESASGRRVFPAEDRSVSERSTVEQVSEKRNGEYEQWQYSQLAEPSWRSVDLNVENQQWQDVQLAPSHRFVDLNMENQQWQDSQVAPSQRSVDLNVENQQWQDSQLPESSHRNLDLNVESQPVKEKQTGELVTENQDEQNRRLHAQLASYPFGDYWSDPCMEFAFKTLTGALPVEDTLAFQGSTHQEYNTSYTQADDGCFELPLFNTSSFYLNDAPNHCAPSEEHVVNEQPALNQTFLPTGNNSIPGHSSVVSQNPGLTFLPNGNNSISGCSSVVSQNPGLNAQAKDYQSKFKSHR